MFRKRLFLLVSLVACSVLLMTVQVKTGRSFNLFRFLSYPLNAMNRLITEGISAVKSPYLVLRAAMRDNELLVRENADLKLRVQEYHELRAENARLRDILDLKGRMPGTSTAARVISRGPDQSVRSFIINKGSSDRVQKDMIAVTPDGLVGKIVRVWPAYAELLSVTDSAFSVSVRLQDSRVEGILTGTGSGCTLNYVMNEVEVRGDDVLITSGLDRFYPEGIRVGRVTSVQKTVPELFQNITVAPFADVARLEEVVLRRP